MLLLGVRIALVLKRAQRGNQARSRLSGFDYRVYIAALRSNIRIGETLAELLNFLFPQALAFGLGRAFDLPFVDDVYGTFGSHDGNFRRGPGEIRIGADVFAGHNAM